MSFVPPHVPNSVHIGVPNVFPIYVACLLLILLFYLIYFETCSLCCCSQSSPCPQLNPKPSTSVGCVVGPSVNWYFSFQNHFLVV
jgi:hypothetical protein